MKNILQITESFYSLQGEGASAGKPAVFLRLSLCNLNCSWCDTKEAQNKGTNKTFIDIINYWKNKGWLLKLEEGAHLVITGGEPTLQANSISEFLVILKSTINKNYNVEIETNGTIDFPDLLLKELDIVNVSPKLANSNNLINKSYKVEILKKLCVNKNINLNFKFAVSGSKDIIEIKKKYIAVLKISANNIWLMPVAATSNEFVLKSAKVANYCMDYGFNYSPRLHITDFTDKK